MSGTLWHGVSEQIEQAGAQAGWPRRAVRRLAVLVSGVVAAQSTVLAEVASAVLALEVTAATLAASVERGLRRTLSDQRLQAGSYQQALAGAVDWGALRQAGAPVVLALDDSSQDQRIHLLRLALTYWGGSIPVAWAVWEQNVPLPAGQYWQQVEAVLADAARLIPPDLSVVVTADRAFDIAPFVDRVAAHGWHWVVRARGRSDLRYRDYHGREHAVRTLLARHLDGPGRRWRGRGQVFKTAGWRTASIVAVWAVGRTEPLVVLSDLPPRWELVGVYGRRFWIEPGFRTDKTRGWQWEDSGVVGVAHHQVLVVAMAWATLLTVGVGIAEATRQLRRLRLRPLPRGRTGWWGCAVERARHSVFTLGLRQLSGGWASVAPAACRWQLPDPAAPAWNDRWRQAQIARNLRFVPVRP